MAGSYTSVPHATVWDQGGLEHGTRLRRAHQHALRHHHRVPTPRRMAHIWAWRPRFLAVRAVQIFRTTSGLSPRRWRAERVHQRRG